ncbi:MAG: flagellar protein FliT [Gammaproteobacteria bacterium]|nr:flagellar protein FliT [Gammaproteobacteria bacterium]NNF60026.1 flagellar protein FliT [Gammaproteobacteria bacterium]NNM19957.1 flagellar protein FliT [Gammaproteobacteria bacterium]
MNVGSERAEQLEEIFRLCTDIEGAVRNADWDAAGTLLSRRHHLLELAFADTPTTADEVRQLHEVAEQVMTFDRQLMPVAEKARGEAAAELKNLRRGRAAADAYQQNSR